MVNAQTLRGFQRKDALVTEVVDAEERAGAGKVSVSQELLMQVKRDQSRLPVVSMDDIRNEVEVAGELNSGTAEQTKTFGIVWVVMALLAVELVAVIVFRVVKKVDLNALEFSCTIANLVAVSTHGNRQLVLA